jgi:hypothetical protein
MSLQNATWYALAVLAAIAFLGPRSAAAQGGPWLPAPGEFYSGFQTGFYSADTYHDSRGHRATLAFGGVEERRSLLSYNEIGWKKGASVVVGIPVVSITRLSAGREVNRTDTGISDVELGLRLKMAEGATAAALELSWYAPAGYNSKYLLSPGALAYADASDCAGLTGADSVNCARQLAAPRLGAGEQEVSAVIHWGTSVKRWNGFLQLSNGYLHRGQLAGQALLTADLGFWLGSSVLVAGRYRGAIDVGRGPTLADDMEEHLAGPVLLFRLDDDVDVFASSLHTAIARNAIHADRFYLGVAFKKTGLDRLQGYLGGTRRP